MLQNILNSPVFSQLLRLLCATVCGFLIGLEREHSNKDAGLRTHALVALGSALLVILSRDGFLQPDGTAGGVDISRVAASIVPGIGFLGAGSIIVRKDRISGLTTSAGILVTAAVGMAFGCGLYALGFLSAGLMLLILYGIKAIELRRAAKKKRRAAAPAPAAAPQEDDRPESL